MTGAGRPLIGGKIDAAIMEYSLSGKAGSNYTNTLNGFLVLREPGAFYVKSHYAQHI